MTDGKGPDYSELLRSPYDPDPDDQRDPGEGSELPWVPAVVASALGALVVGAFVIYSVVVGPTTPETSTSVPGAAPATPAPVASAEFPVGFTALTDQVAAAVEAVDAGDATLRLGVATAVRGGTDPSEVVPVDVATWSLEAAGVVAPMRAQYTSKEGLGNVTIEFAPIAGPSDLILRARVATSSSSETVVLDLEPTVPQTVTDYRIDLDGGVVVVIDEITIGDGWGWLAWHAEGDGSVAKVDAAVTFVGTDDPASEELVDPTTLVPSHLRPVIQGSGRQPLAPLYGATGGGQLIRVGEPLAGQEPPTAISVAFTVTIPDGISSPIDIPVPSGS
jgi:hypothetical protein